MTAASSTAENNVFLNAMTVWTALSVINFIASIATLFLIRQVGKTNGYMLMVTSMTVAQGAFDASLLMFDSNSSLAQEIQIFIGAFAGTAAALWSLALCFLMTYIVSSRKYVDIEKNFRKYFIAVTLICGVLGAVILVSHVKSATSPSALRVFTASLEFFNGLRIAIIVATMCSIIYAFVQLRAVKMTTSQSPVYTIVRRLCLYPLIQLFSRLPITVYQLIYNQPLREFAFATTITPARRLWFMLSVVFTPAAGIGNFAAFLCVQPEAWAVLTALVLCRNVTDAKAIASATRKENFERSSISGKNSAHHSAVPDRPPSSRETSITSSLYEIEPEYAHGAGAGARLGAGDGAQGGLADSGSGTYTVSDDDGPVLDYDAMDEEQLVREIARASAHRASTAAGNAQTQKNPVHDNL